jgi:hypothetical protein
MKVSPICQDTTVSRDAHIWTPRDFDDFTKELDHIKKSAGDHLLVYRGQANYRWLLESTFVRNCKRILLGIDSWLRPSTQIRERGEYNQAIFGIFLLKFGLLVKASMELVEIEKTDGIDAQFEMLKRFQQYPVEDTCAIKGTFFMDWSTKPDVALFFANYDSDEHLMRRRQNDGALFICDASATGKTLMRNGKREPEAIKVEEIVQRMMQAHNDSKSFGCPLLFYPPKQLHNLRANNQEAAYWAQMDFARDLESVWLLKEKEQNMDESIYVKLVLPYATERDAQGYLANRGITHSYLYPD